jgi:hypothetical protein
LFTRYSEIPQKEFNFQKRDWEPDFAKTIKKSEDTKEIIECMKKGEMRANERNPLALLG